MKRDRTRLRPRTLGAAGWLCLLMTGPLFAGQAGIDTAPGEGAREKPHLSKVANSLLEARRLAAAGASEQAIRRALPRLPLGQGTVVVEVRLRGPGAPLASLERAGLLTPRAYPRWNAVTGRIAFERLDELAALAEVLSVRPIYPPRRRTGVVTGQGDVSSGAAAARTQFGVDGSGVTVGVISDSFNDLPIGGSESAETCAPFDPTVNTMRLTGSTPQTQNELPAEIDILDNCTAMPPLCDDLRDEGRALAEIIHDLAPGARILFRSGFNGEPDFATGIDELVSCGADVIVDDLIYDREPMFQDGPIAQAVDDAVAAGVAYFTAAGNEADRGADEMYVDVDPMNGDIVGLKGQDFHDFGGADPYAAISLAPGCGLAMVLQWNEPFDGASTDLDLAVCSGQTPGACAYANGGIQEDQGCRIGLDPFGEPLETGSHLNSGASRQTIYLVVDRNCSLPDGPMPADVRFRLVLFAQGTGCSLGDSEAAADCSTSSSDYCFEPGIFDTYPIYGHAAAVGAVAVGASFYDEIDSNGTRDLPVGQIDVEPFSSVGGNLPFFFDANSNALPGAPVFRFKPDVTAPDGGNTSFFGTDLPDDVDGYPNFLGTSAAAPHAAAVAALMLDLESGLGGSDLGKILACTARDIEGPGVDVFSGAGLIDAVAALTALPPAVALVKSAALTNNVGDPNRVDAGDLLTYTYQVTNPNAVPLEPVTVTDPHAGLSAIGCPGGHPIPALAAGAMATCTATYTVTAGDVAAGSITNLATATGLACGVAAADGEDTDGLTLPTCVLDRVLPSTVEGGTGVEEVACWTLSSGPSYTVQAGAEVTFRAGRMIIFEEDFTAAGTFTAVLDPEIDL